MKISPEGKTYLTQVLAESEVKSLRFFGIQGCCGMNLSVALDPAQETDKVKIIEGIAVAVDPTIEAQLTDVTIHAEEENGNIGLVLLGYAPTSC
ncbi:Fe-S cluster assembly protein HesB [Solibacillus sp. FSL H8-0538]|uniref:Fe-S cluster assembly protein HesB n=1 Tax=Solibacillus sp. FSL H8-0538 TaxID=2921400 RepID=UPI0030F92231